MQRRGRDARASLRSICLQPYGVSIPTGQIGSQNFAYVVQAVRRSPTDPVDVPMRQGDRPGVKIMLGMKVKTRSQGESASPFGKMPGRSARSSRLHESAIGLACEPDYSSTRSGEPA